ncbi:MAG: ABC transporter permease [Candidatus Deferrimicrobiaceae bacterium]
MITPPAGWRMVDVRRLWACRELIGVLAARDIKVRYRQTVLGSAWVILQALATTGIFTAIFGYLVKIPSEGYPYAVFVYAALLPWTFFVSAVNASANSLVGSAALIGKVYFPRLVIPLASIGSGLVDLAVSTAFLLILLPLFGVGWTAGLLAVPFLAAAVAATALGIGILFSALIVAYRDFRNVVSFLMQLWLFATPVVYPVGLIPAKWRWVLHLNPMTGLVEGFRAAFLGKPFDIPSLCISIAMGTVLLAVGVGYFEKVEARFADII